MFHALTLKYVSKFKKDKTSSEARKLATCYTRMEPVNGAVSCGLEYTPIVFLFLFCFVFLLFPRRKLLFGEWSDLLRTSEGRLMFHANAVSFGNAPWQHGRMASWLVLWIIKPKDVEVDGLYVTTGLIDLMHSWSNVPAGPSATLQPSADGENPMILQQTHCLCWLRAERPRCLFLDTPVRLGLSSAVRLLALLHPCTYWRFMASNRLSTFPLAFISIKVIHGTF